MRHILLSLLVISFSQSAAANTLLTYVGNNFTSVSIDTPAPGAYTTSMRVSVMAELISPLAANFNGEVFPVDFSFSDGRFTFGPTVFPISSFPHFFFTTDVTGAITAWNVFILRESGSVNRIQTIKGAGSTHDSAQFDFMVNEFTEFASVFDSPGVWTVAETVPEPSTLALVLCGFMLAPFIRPKIRS